LISLQYTCTVSWINNQTIPERTAHYSLRFGLHATNALIPAGLQQMGVKRFYTADNDFGNVSLPELSIQILKQLLLRQLAQQPPQAPVQPMPESGRFGKHQDAFPADY